MEFIVLTAEAKTVKMVSQYGKEDTVEAVDELTLQLIAQALPRLSLGIPEELKAIRINKKTSELVFELNEGSEVVVTVTQDTDKFYFRLGGGQYATIDKTQVLGKAH